jgi:CheY-like chemotaxis protein
MFLCTPNTAFPGTHLIDPATPIRILVVDDEPLVADTMSMLLKRLGFDATGMTDPSAALERVEAAPDEFDLLLTDQMMPAMTGDVLARRVIGLRPDLPVVIMTGFSFDVTPENAHEIGVAAVLHKPLSPEQLKSAIRAALAPTPPTR